MQDLEVVPMSNEIDLKLDCPKLKDARNSVILHNEVNTDDTLKHCRELATRKLNGYNWDKDLLMHSMLDETGTEVSRIVIPKSWRPKILELAHDKTSHTGVRGMRSLIGSKFT